MHGFNDIAARAEIAHRALSVEADDPPARPGGRRDAHALRPPEPADGEPAHLRIGGTRTFQPQVDRTGEPVYWPAPAQLRVILKDAPQHDAITLCANSAAKPWTASGFRASWRKIRLKLEAEQRVNSGLTLYGLRHTVAVILRVRLRERTIADALGQKTIEMARHYARGA